MTSPESILERYIAAVRTLDKQALLALYADDVRMFDMMMPWEFASRDGFIRRVDQWFDSGIDEPDAVATDVHTRISGELAVMTMFMNYVDTDDAGERSTMTNRLTWVLARTGDEWQIVHEHTSVPINEDDDMQPVWEK